MLSKPWALCLESQAKKIERNTRLIDDPQERSGTAKYADVSRQQALAPGAICSSLLFCSVGKCCSLTYASGRLISRRLVKTYYIAQAWDEGWFSRYLELGLLTGLELDDT